MRPLLCLAASALLLFALGCEQFNGHIDPIDPGPGPGPDPPVRDIVVTPGTTAEAGTTLSFGTSGDPLLPTDLVTWNFTANGDTSNRFPRGASGVVFPAITQLGQDLSQDLSFSVPPMARPVTPGNYTLKVRESGDGYAPIDRQITLTINAAAAGTFRNESTEIPGLPPASQANTLNGVLLPAHAVALSDGDGGDGLGELIVVMARQQRMDSASEEVTAEFVLYIGHVESGYWSAPIVLSSDPRDLTPQTNPPTVLREYGARSLQSFGIHADGRELELAWADSGLALVYKAATITPIDGAIGLSLGERVEVAPGPIRVVPLRAQDGRGLLVCTTGTPTQSQSLQSFLIDRTSGVIETRLADIIGSSSTTARMRAHDAALATDGTLRIAGLESASSQDEAPDITYVVVEPNFLAVTERQTVQGNVLVTEPPSILVSGSGEVWIAYAAEEGAEVAHIDGASIDIPALGGEVTVRNVDLALNPASPDQVLILVQQGSGSTLENVQGTLKLLTSNFALDALIPFDGGTLPASIFPATDNGPGNVVAGIGAVHVIWQENGVGLNHNARILEARTG